MSSRFSVAIVLAGITVSGFSTSSWAAFDLANTLAAGGEKTYTTTGLSKNSMNYRVFLPDGYNSATSYPVILYLHSAAERDPNGKTDAIFEIENLNGDGKIVDNPWLGALIKETQHGDHKAIVITPEAGWYQYWCAANNGENWNTPDFTSANAPAESDNEKLAMGILNKVVNSYSADKNRVYVTGPSMGGWGTWDLIGRHASTFAAAVPLSGGGNLTDASTTLYDKPIWAFHGLMDSLISPDHTGLLYDQTSKVNSLRSFVPLVGHGGWDLFYSPDTYTTTSTWKATGVGTDLYDWLFAQSLPEPTSLSLLAAGSLFLLRRRVAC